MLILLPPSERKTPRRRGRAVRLHTLSFPELTTAREHLLSALADVSALEDAASNLGLPPTLSREVAGNVSWRTAPAQRVDALYSGVLYDALGLATLPVGARRRAASRLVVVSAAWGLLRLDDRVPAYRLSMGMTLSGVGPVAAYWREWLAPVLDSRAAGHLVVDCRSATYASAWRPGRDVAPRTVAVRVLRDVAGSRSVVSHLAKHTRGLVARHLVSRSGPDPTTPERLAAVLEERWSVELGPPARDGQRKLDLVLSDGPGQGVVASAAAIASSSDQSAVPETSVVAPASSVTSPRTRSPSVSPPSS